MQRSACFTTPKADCGLLEGVMRAELLERGELVEEVVTLAESKRNAIFEMVVSVISKAGLNSTVSNGGPARSSDAKADCGLLEGVMRAELLERGELVEEVVTLAEVKGGREGLLLGRVKAERDIRDGRLCDFQSGIEQHRVERFVCGFSPAVALAVGLARSSTKR
jgi:hypothetical protein